MNLWSAKANLAPNRLRVDRSASSAQYRYISSNPISGEFGLPTSTERAFSVQVRIPHEPSAREGYVEECVPRPSVQFSPRA